ncbi:MAG: Multifunctional CCA protein [Deltaproteobacteria bacterium ADurb.Bin510]|nr:MAG: Multifunctional CCA protein [Deltaproteobacteria bacterium ADurb.Bin510]
MPEVWSTVCGPSSPLKQQPAWLVGGCVRDHLLGRPVKDYDLVVDAAVWPLAEMLAQTLNASCFWLDREREVARVASSTLAFHVDLCRLNGASLAEDLRRRDFTINAIACDLSGEAFIDPLNGRADLQAGLIRLVSDQAINDDPLRSLRGLRFSLLPGFRLEESTAQAIRAATGLLNAVAAERIRQELLAALRLSSRIFELLGDYGLLEAVLGLRSGNLEALLLGEQLLESGRLDGSAEHFVQEIEGEVSRAELLKVCLFCGEAAEDTLRRLKFSRRSRKLAATLKRQLAAFESDTASDSLKRYRWLRDAADCAPELLVAAHCRGQLPELDVLWAYYRQEFSALRPLITGADLTGFEGPAVGRILRQALELQAVGRLTNREQALAWLADPGPNL